MIKRYIVDGPPGSAKTTLLFGRSDSFREGDPIVSPNLSDRGYNCMRESAVEAHWILARQGIDSQEDMQGFLQVIVELDLAKYLSANNSGTYFFDRSHHHWRHFRDIFGLVLPDRYDEIDSGIRYSNPVFLIAPVKGFDLTQSGAGPRSRRFTWEQRLASYERTKALYLSLGYEVVEVPVFNDGDIQQNNRARIAQIQRHIEG